MPGMQELSDLLKSTGIQEAGLKPLTDKIDKYNSLVTQSNIWVAQVSAARAQDPNNVDYLDSLWATHAPSDEKMAAIEEEYQTLIAESEKKLKELREFAKTKVQPPLSEEEARDTRKKVNDAAPVIAETRKGIQAQFEMVENILKLTGAKLPEGGLVEFLPTADSLKSTRGRKAATASGEGKQYVTRIGEAFINGESTNIDGKGRFSYAADKLTEMFNGKSVPTNKVTKEELEEAYFASLKDSNGNPVAFRGLSSTEIPEEHTFTFSKTIRVQNKNDDSFTEVPQNVKVVIRSTEFGKAKDEGTNAESTKPVDANGNEPKAANVGAAPEPMKIDTKSETRKASESNKQPAAKPEAKPATK
jgi:hypothetical protein